MVCTFVIVASMYRSSARTLIVETSAHVVLPHAIKALKAKGYKLVTLAECLGVKPYKSVKAPQSVCFVPPSSLFTPVLTYRLQGTWKC